MNIKNISNCIKRIPNKFELVVIAAAKAESIFSAASSLHSERKNNIEIEQALEFIANEDTDIDALKKLVISKNSPAKPEPEFKATKEASLLLNDEIAAIEKEKPLEMSSSLFGGENLDVQD